MNNTLNRQMYALLKATGLTEQKESLVYSYTDGRTDKSSEMYDYEAQRLVKYLQSQNVQSAKNTEYDKNDKLRKVILSNWYKIENAETKEQKALAVEHCKAWVLKCFKGGLNDFVGKDLYKIKLASDKVLQDKASSIRRAVKNAN